MAFIAIKCEFCFLIVRLFVCLFVVADLHKMRNKKIVAKNAIV